MLPNRIASNIYHLIYILVAAKLLFSCFGLVALNRPLFATSHFQQLVSQQHLPLEAKWCLPIGECLLLEVADKDSKKKLGLMYRKSLQKNTGMLFKFAPPRIVRFWMYETYIPLDMIFLINGKIISIESNVQPCLSSPCPRYGPNDLVDSVIELPAGDVERLKIGVDDSVEIEYLR